MPRLVTPTRSARTDNQWSALGILSESFDFATQINNAVATSGASTAAPLVSLLGLRAGDVVSNIVCFMVTNSTSLTLCKLGLWSSAGTLLANTASAHVAFNNSGNNATFMVTAIATVGGSAGTAYTIPTDGGYYAGIVSIGTTGPTITRGASVTGSSGAIGSGARRHATSAVVADIGDITPAATSTHFWFAVS